MTRREIREQIFRILFRIEFHQKDELPEQLKYPIEEDAVLDADSAYIQEKIQAVTEKLDEIDAMINAVAKGWKTSRMAKVDLTIIRLAVFEIKFEEGIPTGVAINEAVELAKKYGTEESPGFVNAILAKIL